MPDHNIGNDDDLSIMAWTYYGSGYDEGKKRAFLEFDLSDLPSDAGILEAKLSLYNNPNSRDNWGSHSGNNEVLLQRVTEPWAEYTLTWNNQPATSSVGAVSIPKSSSANQDYEGIDITDFVKDWHADPTTNFGMLLRLKTETIYSCMIFASSDNTDSDLHPKLYIRYRE